MTVEPSTPGPHAAGPLLQAAGVSKCYGRSGAGGRRSGRRGAVWALRDVDLEVREGETVGVVGESGSGKSTLVRLLLALDSPTAGEVCFAGEALTGRPERDLRHLRRRAQVVLQDPVGSLDPRMRVERAVTEPLRALRLPGDHHARGAEVLAAVGLGPGTGRRFPHQLSGGQRQRVAIARALAPSPDVLVADEPVSALDVSVRAQVLNVLGRLVSDLGLTLVMVSHDLAVVAALCRRVVVLHRGEVVEEGSTEDVYLRPSHPYTRQLLAAVPRLAVGGRS